MKQNEGGHCNISGMSARSGGRLAHDKVVNGVAVPGTERPHQRSRQRRFSHGLPACVASMWCC